VQDESGVVLDDMDDELTFCTGIDRCSTTDNVRFDAG
ncbi:unnamed protein product, partial [Rotaria magnacalcarata]